MDLSRPRQRKPVFFRALGWLFFLLAISASVSAFASTKKKIGAMEDQRTVSSSFREMGQYDSIQLRGTEATATINFGVRLDEVVSAATLTLRYGYSPSLISRLSHLRIKLNGELVQTLPLVSEQAGRELTREIELDPRYFTDFNRLEIQLIGHYTDGCEDEMHSSLWATLSHQSQLKVSLRPVTQKTDLALLPTPFFDRRDNRRLTLPFSFASQPSLDVLRHAGVVASWFGTLASYRGARFPVLLDRLPEQNGVVFATNDQRPRGLTVGKVDGPTITLIEHPEHANAKLLLVLGRNADDLRIAAEGLVLGQLLMSGRSATVNAVRIDEKRKPHDAPNFVRTDRPVKFSELIASAGELQANGHAPGPIRLNLRLPADLLTWHSQGVPIDLKYRYTPPVDQDNSTLTINLNDKFVQAFRLKPSGRLGEKNRVILPLLDDGSLQARDDLRLPAFQVGSDNQLQFQFTIDYHQQGRCKDTLSDAVRAAIDPDSSIDLTSFPHYTAMPNLTLFANAGFPFTKFADLSETAVVLPTNYTAQDIEQAYYALSRLGRMSGLPGLRYALVTSKTVDTVSDRDLLVIDRSIKDDFLARQGKNLPATLTEVNRVIAPLALAQEFSAQWFGKNDRRTPSENRWQVDIGASGDLSALLGFQSPYNKERSVVAFSSPQKSTGTRIADTLDDGSKIGRIRGDITLFGESTIDSFQVQDHYYVGELPWWMYIWFHLARYPALIAILGIAGGMILSIWAFFTLRAMARRRLGRD